MRRPLCLVGVLLLLTLPAGAEDETEEEVSLETQRDSAKLQRNRLEIYLKNAPLKVDLALKSLKGQAIIIGT